jgi:hypothetical protein
MKRECRNCRQNEGKEKKNMEKEEETRQDKTRQTFQKGSMPVGSALLNTFTTLQVSTMIKAIDRHIDRSMIPKRGETLTSSQIPKLYSRLIVQKSETVVATHHGSL